MLQNFRNILALFKSSKALNLATLLLIVAAVPLTVFIAQKQQETRQRAAEPSLNSKLILAPTLSAPLETNIPTPTPFVCTACAADIKKDYLNRVNATDYAVLASCYSKSLDYKLSNGYICANADINGDGLINDLDYQCLQSQYLKTCTPSTPSPTLTPTPVLSVGLEILDFYTAAKINNIDVKGPSGTTIPAFVIRSIGSTQWTIFGSPTTFGRGIDWDSAPGVVHYLTPNYSTSISIIVANNVPVGVYTGTGLIKDDKGLQLNLPIKVTVTGTKRVFVTSNRYFGNFIGGLSGADTKCQERANAVYLGGTWKAWLSDSTSSVTSRFNHFDGAYKLLNGTIIANNWNDLTDGTILSPINITETGALSSSNYTTVWTNTLANGNAKSVDRANTCYDWSRTGSDAGISYMGRTHLTDFHWSDDGGGFATCNTDSKLYCFEQ